MTDRWTDGRMDGCFKALSHVPGMNKMVINHFEKLFVTKDAGTVIKELEIQHPAARMLVMATQMMEQEVREGGRRCAVCSSLSVCSVLHFLFLKTFLSPFNISLGISLPPSLPPYLPLLLFPPPLSPSLFLSLPLSPSPSFFSFPPFPSSLPLSLPPFLPSSLPLSLPLSLPPSLSPSLPPS